MNTHTLQLWSIYSFEINEIPLSISEGIKKSWKKISDLLWLLEVIWNGKKGDDIYFFIKWNNKWFCMNIDTWEKWELDKICKNTKSKDWDIDDGSENALLFKWWNEDDTY